MIWKSLWVRPGTKLPFLSVTVIGSRTRRIKILSVPCGVSGGVGEAFGFCAEAESEVAVITKTSGKYLNKNCVRRADMLMDNVRELRFDAFAPELVALSRLISIGHIGPGRPI